MSLSVLAVLQVNYRTIFRGTAVLNPEMVGWPSSMIGKIEIMRHTLSELTTMVASALQAKQMVDGTVVRRPRRLPRPHDALPGVVRRSIIPPTKERH